MLTDVRKLQLKYTILCYQKYVDKEVTTIKIIVHFSDTKAQPTKLKCSQDNTLPPPPRKKTKQNKTKKRDIQHCSEGIGKQIVDYQSE